MRLIAAILGFVLKKAVLVGAVLVAGLLVFGLGRLMPDVQQAGRDLDELQRVRAEQSVLGEALRSRVRSLQIAAKEAERTAGQEFSDLSSTAAKRVQAAKDACGVLGRLEPYVPGPNPCTDAKKKADAAQAKAEAAREALHKARERVTFLARDDLSPAEKLERLHADTAQVQKMKQLENDEARLRDVEGSLAGRFAEASDWVAKQWAQSWKWLLWVALLVVFAPLIGRAVGYWLLMPLVTWRHKPLRLAVASDHPAASIDVSPAVRTLRIPLTAGEVLSARSEYIRGVQGKVRSQVLYDWGAPFTTFAAGLNNLSRITGDADAAEETLAAPGDPNLYLMRIDFKDHPGVVMRPTQVVGVMGAPELKKKWHWGIQSFATWQLRYILFTGTGSLIVQGRGDVNAPRPGDRPVRIEQDLMMGFDSRLTAGVNRTEVFWEYLLGKTPLIDREFTGSYPYFWQTSTSGKSSNPIVKATNAVFSALGKLLGF